MADAGSLVVSDAERGGKHQRLPRHESNEQVMNGTLQQQIVSKFLEKLAESEHLDARQIGLLRTLLRDSKRPKADDFLKIFSLTANGDVE